MGENWPFNKIFRFYKSSGLNAIKLMVFQTLKPFVRNTHGSKKLLDFLRNCNFTTKNLNSRRNMGSWGWFDSLQIFNELGKLISLYIYYHHNLWHRNNVIYTITTTYDIGKNSICNECYRSKMLLYFGQTNHYMPIILPTFFFFLYKMNFQTNL